MAYDWEKMRKEEWPVLETMTFLDAACVSFAPQRSVRAVKAFADMTATQEEANSSAHHIAMDDKRHKAYVEAAKLLNADPEEIALVESTSHGLNIAAQGIQLQDGDNIVTTNLEFIQVALPWCVIRKEKNIDIRVCKPADERFTAAAFAPLVDEKTKILVMSTLEWCNGWQSDMKEIGDFCKERGIYLVVDAVQQLGVTKIDTKACHIDILTAGGHKWLNSPYGTGVLYVNKETLPKLKQSYAGYLNTTVPEGGWGAYWENPAAPSVNDWTFPMTARRFEIGGTSNYVGAVALGESLGLVNEIGIENIEARVREIATHLLAREEDGALLGYVRLLPSWLHYDGYAENSFGRLSVKESARGRGLGAQLVRMACQRLAEDTGDPAVRISAMSYLEKFCRDLGFERTSEEFTIAGVPHVTMLYPGK